MSVAERLPRSLAEIVSSAGAVDAVEIDAGLARRAKANLAHVGHVRVTCADGVSYDPGNVDAIFINAGVTHPQRVWQERLNNDGRLLVPLTVVRPHLSANGSGQTLLVLRLEDKYQASFISG